MAACGLIPGQKNAAESDSDEGIHVGEYLTTMVNFAAAMTRVLKKFNDRGDEYQLRIGQHYPISKRVVAIFGAYLIIDELR